MTDLTVHVRSGSHILEDDFLECNNEVQRLNPHIYNRQDNQQIGDDDELGSGENPQGGGGQGPADKDLFKYVTLKSRNKETGSIIIDQDLKLMLLRHWTLFDSLCNSNYLVSRLTLWKE